MKTINQTLAMLLALGVSALATHAQDDTNTPPGGFRGPHGHRPPAPLIIGALDANHDGVIDADEIANASAALQALDKNGDGKLTWDEFMGRPPGAPTNAPAGPPPGLGDSTNTPPAGMGGPGGRHHRMPAVVRALDANHDGVIDADEIAKAPAVLKALDKNGDGKLTPDEFDGTRPPGGPRGGGPNGANAGGPPPGDQGGPGDMAGPDDVGGPGPGPGDNDAPPQDPPQ